MSLYYYNEEEDKKKEGEESIDKYLKVFEDISKNPPSLEEALKEMYIKTGSTEIEAEELKEEIISKCKQLYKKKVEKEMLKKKYSISKEEANIISSYTCESKKNKKKSPYRILNQNLVSQNREEGISNISKYLYIFLKTLRKLGKYKPENKILFRCIKTKVNINPKTENPVPYALGNIKTLWGFTSTSLEMSLTFDFLDKVEPNIKNGTVFTFEGDVWGYDIQPFSDFKEKEILIEPERKIKIIEKPYELNGIINIRAEFLKHSLVLDDKKDNKKDNLDISIVSSNNNPNMNLNNINNFNSNQMMNNQIMNNQIMNNQIMNNQIMNNQIMNNQIMNNQIMNNPMMNNPMINNPMMNNIMMNNQIMNNSMMNNPMANNQIMNNPMMNNQIMNNPIMNNLMMNNPMMNNIMFQNQMNQNNQNNNNQNEKEPVMPIFYNNSYDYNFKQLTDQKKTIIFKDPLKNKTITKQIPIHFTKNELYSLVNGLNMAKTVLMYEKNILDDDNSSIKDISDNATILLFLPPSYNNFKNSGLYQYLCNNYPNQKINVYLEVYNKEKQTYCFYFSEEFPISLMIKFFCVLFDNKNYRCFFNDKFLEINDNRKIGDLISNTISRTIKITFIRNKDLQVNYFEGKIIKVAMFYKNRNIFKFYSIGKYSPISRLFYLENYNDLNNKKIIYNGEELNKNDERSLASLGINGDFGCIVEEI